MFGLLTPRTVPGVTVTSEIAAAAALATSGQQRMAVLYALVASGDNGLTDEQIQTHTGLEGNNVRPRRGECAKEGWIRRAGRRRQTAKNRQAEVWVATMEGIDELMRVMKARAENA